MAAANLSLLLKRRKDRSYEQDSNSALHSACYYGDYSAALMLLLANHSTASRNVWRETPLHQCTAQGHLDIMMLLLDGGAEVNACDKDDYTPLHHAIIRANVDATELLLCYGARLYGSERDPSSSSSTRAPIELAAHVHVCHEVLHRAEGRVWSLQHLCRIAIRRYMGVSRRRRIKELPFPRHLHSYLTSLPVAHSDQLHANWERTRTTKSAAIKSRVAGHRPRPSRVTGLHQLRRPSS